MEQLSVEQLQCALLECEEESQNSDNDHKGLLVFQFHLMVIFYQLTFPSRVHLQHESTLVNAFIQYDQQSNTTENLLTYALSLHPHFTLPFQICVEASFS